MVSDPFLLLTKARSFNPRVGVSLLRQSHARQRLYSRLARSAIENDYCLFGSNALPLPAPAEQT